MARLVLARHRGDQHYRGGFMIRALCVTVLLAVPVVSFGETSTLRLLDDSALSFASSGMPGTLAGTARIPALAEEAPPKRGLVYGFMGGGGGAALFGIIADISGAYVFAAAQGCSSNTNCWGRSLLDVVAVFELVVGTNLIIVGAILFFTGNALRLKRNEMLSARNVSFNFVPAAKAPAITYAFHF
jgi:hypothetical protein